MKLQHTLGEWQVDSNKSAIVKMNTYFRIEQTATSENLPDNMSLDDLEKEGDANAKLIAAAPDLLNTCIEVLSCLQNAPHREYERNLLETIIKKATT